MANTTIKITQLPSIGNGISASTILPVVNTSGTAVTEKVTVGAVANYVLTQAGNTLSPAFLSTIAYSVSNSSQPNITSVGTLSVDTLKITGGIVGYYLQTDGSGNLAWASGGSGNSSVGGSNTQVQFNDAGAFGGNTGFTFNKTTGLFNIAGNISGGNLVTGGQVVASGNVSSGTGLTTGGFLSVDGTADLHDTTVTGYANVTGTANTVGGGATVGVRSILAIDSAFGSNNANDPASAQAVRGRVTGNNLTKTRNYVAGVTGQYLVTGTNASEFINTGLLGVVGDQTTTANAAVVAYLDGDGGLTTAGSAYGVSMKNSTPGSGFDYGLDLQFIDLNVAGTTTPFKQADIRFNNGVELVANTANNISINANVTVDNIIATNLGNIATLNLDGSNSNVLYGNGVFAPASGGGNSSELVNGNNSFVLDVDGNVVFEGNVAGQAVDRGLVWDYGANANGVNSMVRQDNAGLTVRAWTEDSGNFSAPVNIVTNQDANTMFWEFDGYGNLTLPGNLIVPIGNIVSDTLTSPFSSAITGITTGNATVIVAIADSVFPDPYSGTVTISGVTGTTEANDVWGYEAVEVNAFQLYTDATLTTPVDGTTWTAYVSGGTAVGIGLYSNLTVQGGNVSIGSNGETWTFDINGDINIPPNAASFETGRIQSANGYPTLLAYGTGEHGGPELTWAITNNVNDLSNANVIRNTMYINDTGLYVGMNENNVANTFTGGWNFTPNGTIIFPTVEVDLHNGGVQTGQVLQFGNATQQAIITGPTPDANVSAQRIIIQGQRGNGELSEGGDVYVWAGDADTNGGDIKIYAGDADNVSAGTGGYINLDGGSGFDYGGGITLDGGISANGYGGQVNMTGGSGELEGGSTSLQGGFSANGQGGAVQIAGGGGNSQAEYGNVEIGSGIYAWLFDNAGNLVLPGNTFAVNYANGTQVSIGGGNGTPGGSNTQIQFNDNGNFGANSGFTFDSTTGNISIPGTIISGNTITIDNRASGNGADINLYSADDILIQARDRDAGSTAEGGDINIYAGDSAEDSDTSAGDIVIEAGRGGASNLDFGGDGGFVRIEAGAGGNAVGANFSARPGGDLTLNAGDAGTDNGNIDLGNEGGDVHINAGASTGNGDSGGRIILNAGLAGANALAGLVQINIPISDNGNGGTWTFNGSGIIELPNSGTIGNEGNSIDIGSTSAISLEASSAVNIYTDTGTAAWQWQFQDDGNLRLPTIELDVGNTINEQTVIQSQRKIIPGLRYSAEINGTTPTVVYTATSIDTTSMKVTMQIQHTGLGFEFFDVSATSTGGNTFYTVSNRVQPPTIDNSTVVVDLNGSNVMEITVTINSGAANSWVTYDATEFGIAVD
jgi:hypothetical protein